MPPIRTRRGTLAKENSPPPPRCPTESLLPNQAFTLTEPTRQQYSATLLHSGLLPYVLDSTQRPFHHSVYTLNVMHELLAQLQDYIDQHRGGHRRFNFRFVQVIIRRLNQVMMGQLADEFTEHEFERLLAYTLDDGHLEGPPRFVDPVPLPPPSPIALPPPEFPTAYHDQENMPIFDPAKRNEFDVQNAPQQPSEPQQPPTPVSPPYVVHTPRPDEHPSPPLYRPAPQPGIDWLAIAAALPSDFHFS